MWKFSKICQLVFDKSLILTVIQPSFPLPLQCHTVVENICSPAAEKTLQNLLITCVAKICQSVTETYEILQLVSDKNHIFVNQSMLKNHQFHQSVLERKIVNFFYQSRNKSQNVSSSHKKILQNKIYTAQKTFLCSKIRFLLLWSCFSVNLVHFHPWIQ